MTEYWAIGWGDKAWTNAPTNGSEVEGVTLRQFALVSRELGVDDWSACQPSRSPLVIAAWISVLGVEGGLWDDLPAARTELADTPLAVLESCYRPLQGEA